MAHKEVLQGPAGKAPQEAQGFNKRGLGLASLEEVEAYFAWQKSYLDPLDQDQKAHFLASHGGKIFRLRYLLMKAQGLKSHHLDFYVYLEGLPSQARFKGLAAIALPRHTLRHEPPWEAGPESDQIVEALEGFLLGNLQAWEVLGRAGAATSLIPSQLLEAYAYTHKAAQGLPREKARLRDEALEDFVRYKITVTSLLFSALQEEALLLEEYLEEKIPGWTLPKKDWAWQPWREAVHKQLFSHLEQGLGLHHLVENLWHAWTVSEEACKTQEARGLPW